MRSLDRHVVLPFVLMQIYKDEFIRMSMDTGKIEFGQLEQGEGKEAPRLRKSRDQGKRAESSWISNFFPSSCITKSVILYF